MTGSIKAKRTIETSDLKGFCSCATWKREAAPKNSVRTMY